MSTRRSAILGTALATGLLAALPAAAAESAANPHAQATEHGHDHGHGAASAEVLEQQQHLLEENTRGKGFGPQAPRDIDGKAGSNQVAFRPAPPATQLNLCNIHFHANAEHRGGEFKTFAGVGDGHGHGSGFVYSGKLGAAESKPYEAEVCAGEHGSLRTGDTIEVHYVHSSAQVAPGPTLKSCLSEAIANPQLRVEAQVYVLVNDAAALDFNELTRVSQRNGLQQALNIPRNTGRPVEYAGSTTGPDYNEKGSPFQVTWSVRPKVAKVNIASVAQWCSAGNVFKEDHAHGVRNLVANPALLSRIGR